MKPWIKILIGIILAVIIGIGILFYQISPMFSVVDTGKVTDGIYALKDSMANAYIIKDGTNIICIDAGFKVETLRLELEKLAIDPSAVKTVFFTHADGDHTGGAGLFNQAVYILPEMEVPMVNGTVKRRLMGREFNGKLDLPYVTIKDGAIMNIGNKTIRAILTPGHTSGSTSYLVNESYLFTGDLLVLRNGKAEVSWSMLNNDHALSRQSIRKLAKDLKGIRMILTAHSGITRDFKQAMANFK